jgi:hypothetical protein
VQPSAVRPLADLRLPRGLVDQQFWCWGQDVRHPAGDALARHGLELSRAPRDALPARRYHARLAGGRVVALWPFGLFWGVRGLGGLLLPRDDARPRLTPGPDLPDGVWTVQPLLAAPRPRGRAERERTPMLLAGALDWVAGYERWALGALGAARRSRCASAWPRAVMPGPAQAAAWSSLAKGCEGALARRRARGLRQRETPPERGCCDAPERT